MSPVRSLPALPPLGRYIVAASIVLVFFSADFLLPRGATPAIGYCLIPVILSGLRPPLLLGATLICTALTAIGYWVEPSGARPWMSIFDRSMVVGVLWLTFILVRRRDRLFNTQLQQTAALRNLSTELRRSNTDLEQFASTAAHDLRGPLGTVGLLAEVLYLSGSIQADGEALNLLSSIKSELTRMSRLIQSLLAYGHAGAHDIDAVECDCSEVLNRVERSIQSEIDAQGAIITSGLLPTVRADPILIGSLFQNLIENGIKYRAEAPPKIHLSALQQPDGAWLLSVQDNGIGMHAEDCTRAFAPFSQIHRADSPAGGVGLGLATCRRIVERHGGRIWVESKPGEGSAFLFTLPPATRDKVNAGSRGPAATTIARERASSVG